MNKVIRKKGNRYFVLVDKVVRTIFGKLYADVYWMECDEKGNISDGNKDGVIDNETIICKVPDGYDDIDVSTLSDDCLNDL